MKKVVSLFLCLAMLFSMLVTTTMAEGNYNVTMETNKTEVEAGGEFTVTIKNKAMTVSSFACGIFFDTSKLECMSITGALVANSYYLHNPSDPIAPYVIATGAPNVTDSNTTGTVGFAWAGTVDTAYGATTIATVTFKVKANATGSADILLFEDSAGANGAKIGNGYDTYVEAKDDNTLDKDVVTIVAPIVPVTGVTLNTNALSLDINGTATLVATVQPDGASNKAVTFKSNNTAVATVDAEGNVTAVAEGQATITVTTADGGFTDTCVVTVACSHNYTKEDMNAQGALKTEGDCQNQAVYYKSCTKCGKVSTTETFFGEKNPNKHVDAEATWTKTADKHSKTWECCGAVVVAEEDHEWGNDSVCDECGYGCTQHVGGTATCVQQATCDHCGQPYGPLADHSYTAETTKAEALKSESNCRDAAVYYYSCSVCGEVEKNDNHTFSFGMPNPDNHVGQTEIVNAKPADHKTQTKGYTGDTKCLSCGEIKEYGQEIIPEAHTPVNLLGWTTDGTDHWKECTVDVNGSPCGVILVAKEAHSSTGANVATCQKAAVCDVCGVSYGQPADHDWNTGWEKDETGHWHTCKYGCNEKNAFDAHTPDKQGGATEDYGIFCTVCNYEIEKQLEHTHNFNQMNTDDKYLVSAATCSSPAVYKYSCSCGAEGTETFVDPAGTLDPDNHNWDSAWSGADNPDNHWHACLNGCGEKNDVTVHDYKMKFDSTKHWEECVCGRKINEGNHIDTDKDDECDTCGRDMLKPGPGHFGHWDYNGDGRCDYCGAKTGCTHTDANGDGKCDNCSCTMKPIESVQTFDAGILMYAGMAVLAATGSAAMIGKKRKEQ